MKNIHFINVFFFGQTRALDVFFFFFFFFLGGGGGGGDFIKRKKKNIQKHRELLCWEKDYNRTKSPTTNSKRQSTGAYPRRYKQTHAGFKGEKKQTIEG